MTIAVATSTRADWGLLSPLAKELEKRGVDVKVVASNMHLAKGMGGTVHELVEDGFPPFACIGTDGPAENVAAASLIGFSQVFNALKPDAAIILGDRFEMLSVAQAALMKGVPVIHIAGGTVSEGAIDDSVRNAITKIATLHLVETKSCARRVIRMGEDPSTVVVAGALGVWNALNTPLMSRYELMESLDFHIRKRLVVGTLHAATRDPLPPETQMANFLTALRLRLESEPEMSLILTYPNNDVDPAPLVRQLQDFENAMPEQVKVVPSLGMKRYINALREAQLLVGNSSSGIVEAPSTGVSVLDIGIRQKGRECARSVIHCGSDTLSIALGLEAALDPAQLRRARRTANPYVQPDTPSRMVDAILSFPFAPFPAKKFYSGDRRNRT